MTQDFDSAGLDYPRGAVEELDDLTYRRYRCETNASQSFSGEDAQRLRMLVSQLWKVRKVGSGDHVAGAQLEEVVGKGAFGTVWKARDLESGILCAVKVFDVDRLGDGLAVHLFRRGVKAMLYLREQNEKERSQAEKAPKLSRFIVQIRDVEPHMLAFSMDWVPDGDLSKGFIRGRSLEEKLRVFRHIAEAVSYAHSRPAPIVHRDIKPQNIVMDGDIPILTDFDIADMAFAKTLSRRAVGGAFAYAAPEQLSGDCEHLEVRSDVYSLGRLFHFFLLEKDPPLLIEQNPPLDDLNAYPEGLVKIIRRCTHRDLPMRYTSVSELLEDLSQYENAATVGSFGPNLQLAQRHWQRAESLAGQRSWSAANDEAEQAQAYLKELDDVLASQWLLSQLQWRILGGEWRLLPRLLWERGRRLPLPVLVLLCLFAISPLLIPLSRSLHSDSAQKKLEQAIEQIARSPSLQSIDAQLGLAYIKASPSRLAHARHRVTLLLSQHQGVRACRYFRLLYQIAPRSRRTLFFNPAGGRFGPTESFHVRDISGLLAGLKQSKWGPLRCNLKEEFQAFRLSASSNDRGVLWLKIHAPSADLRFLIANHVVFAGAKFDRANLMFAELNKSSLAGLRADGANFSHALLRGAIFVWAYAKGALFRFADVRGAGFANTDLRFADFRGARLEGAMLTFANLRGAIFHASALPAMRKGGIYKGALEQAVCLSGGHFFHKGLVDRCYTWHRTQHLKSGQGLLRRPTFCPEQLSRYGIFVSFRPGSLKQEGVCPWHQRSLPVLWPDPHTTSRPTSRSFLRKTSVPAVSKKEKRE